MVNKIVVESDAKEKELVDLGKSDRKLYFPVREGTIETPDGFRIHFLAEDRGLVRVSTKACKRGPRMNFLFDPDEGTLYGRIRNMELTKHVICLIRGIMFAALYKKKERKVAAESSIEGGKHDVARSKDYSILRLEEDSSLSKDSVPKKASWVASEQSPHTGHKKFTRPKKQVYVRGHFQKTRSGKVVFIPPYVRYLDNPADAEGNKYLI